MVMQSAHDGDDRGFDAAIRQGDRPGLPGGIDQRLLNAILLLMIVERAAQIQPLLVQALAARVSGLILLDIHGQPVFVDDGARVILSTGDGLCLESAGFATGRGPETRRLRLMVARGLRSTMTSPVRRMQMLVTRISRCRPYLVRVQAIAHLEGALGEIVCAVHIHDLAVVHLPDPVLLREAFGLTRREVDLAIELVRAGGLAPAAIAAGMAHNTARNHLHSIFAKCCVATQAEAVRLLAALP